MQDTSSPTLSLIAPTYNERENIPTLVERVHKALDGFEYELIVVDDNSPDGTAELAESLSHKYPVTVICRKNERGLASAVLAGFNCAKGEVLGVIDADLRHPPEKIPELLQAIQGGVDIAVASRYIPGGGIKGWSAKRKIMSSGATMIAHIFLPSIRKVKDPMSGFFLVRRRVIEGIELKPIGYKILLETLAKGKSSEVTEIPYTFEQRALGESNLSLREQLNYLEHVFILASKEREIRRFLQFAIIGGSGILVNMGMLWLLTEFANISYRISGLVSIEASIISNFILNDIWTFRDRRVAGVKAKLIRALKFNLISIVGAAIQYGLYIAFTDLVGLHYLISMLIGITAALIWNFSMNTFWTWRRR
jgi:dolichol-phosphate mannosyltransferase